MKDSLGKTISTLTRVLEGRPTKKDKAAGWSGATLYVGLIVLISSGLLIYHHRVVCPVALVSQWETETKKYTSGLRVIQHHGPSRTTGMYPRCKGD